MESIHYIGLDVHKKTIAFCIKNPERKERSTRGCERRTKRATTLAGGIVLSLDGGHGGNAVYRLDLRFSQAPRR